MCAKLYELKISLAISHKIGVSQQRLSSSLGFWGASDSPADSSCVWWHLSSLWDHRVCWRGQQTEPCAWLKSVAVSQTEKRQYRRPGCPCKAVAWLPRGSCGSPGVQRALGCRGCCWLGTSAPVWLLSISHPILQGVHCRVPHAAVDWEGLYFLCPAFFSLSLVTVFLLPEPRQAVFFCAQLQGVTPLFLTSKAAVWSSPRVTENNHWSRFLTNFDWLVSLVFITFVSFSINTHVTVILLPAGDPELDLLLCYLYSIFVFGISWLILCSLKF